MVGWDEVLSLSLLLTLLLALEAATAVVLLVSSGFSMEGRTTLADF